MAVQLIRDVTGVDGTFGTIRNNDTGHLWQTAELQWLDNAPDVSCIPPGIYDVEMKEHPKHGSLGDLVGMPGTCYEILNVPNRSNILIHIANYAGQESAGEKTDLLGCMALGEDRAKMVPPGYNQPQEAVEHSTQAIQEFYKEMGGKPFMIAITNEFGAA